MGTQERRRERQTWVVGLLLAAVLVAGAMVGVLDPLERAWYDARARGFQWFPPEGVDHSGGENIADAAAAGDGGGEGVAVVHIDDAALAEIGSFPWPRAHLARVVEALDAAGAKVVGVDLLFDWPQEVRYAVGPDGEPGERIDGDAELAAALRRVGTALLPMTLGLAGRDEPSASHGQLERAIAGLLRDDPSLGSQAVRRLLEESDAGADGHGAIDEAGWEQAYFAAREQVVRAWVHAELAEGAEDWRAAFEAAMPEADAGADTVLRRVWQRHWEEARAERAMWRFGRAVDSDGPGARLLEGRELRTPIAALAEAAGGSGFVDWEGEGAVRELPLWIEHEGRAYPQFGLAMAMAMLGVEAEQVVFEKDRLLLPAAGEDDPIVIPTHRRRARGGDGRVGHFMVVPWYGPAERWELMFDIPRHEQPRGQVPLLAVWELVQAQQRLRANNAEVDRAIEHLLAVMDPAGLEAWQAERPAADDWPRRRAKIEQLLADESIAQMIDFAVELREEGQDLDEQTAGMLAAYEALPRLSEANAGLIDRAEARRQWLGERVADRAVFIGWTATGAVADFVTTPLHTRCPGVMVHAAVTQSVLSGQFWRSAPAWWGWAVMLLVAIAVAAAVAVLSPWAATLVAIAIGGGWGLLDGLLIFDFAGIVMPGAAPMLTAAVVWGGCVGWRYLIERLERTRITRRFSSYVDPALVQYVIDHPEQTQLRGEVRELSVVFTDLAGFTTLSEQLGGESVALLNDYMGRMVPLIRQHGGFVNKFLGDGIMCFYGAPVRREDHAAGAVATVLAMQRAMQQFNRDLADRGLGGVGMRAGVASGSMIVGDAGPPDASDYTVLGDTVNLAARLESANKATGTAALITERTVELMGEGYAVRPIGRLQVVGKQEGVMVYEPMGEHAELDAAARQLIEQTRQMVEAYQAARFDACVAAAESLERHPGSQKLVQLYRDACHAELEGGGHETFAGQIVLTEK